MDCIHADDIEKQIEGLDENIDNMIVE